MSDQFGTIVSYEWDWGNDGTVDCTEPFFVDPISQLILDTPCKVTVTDDDNNRVEKHFTVTSELLWDKVGTLPEELRDVNIYSLFSVSNKWIISDYKNHPQEDFESECWVSEDKGLSWEKLPNNLPFRLDRIFYHQNNYFVQVSDSMDIRFPGGTVKILKSSDLISWQTVLERRNMKFSNTGPVLYHTDERLFCNFFDTTSIADTIGKLFKSDDMGLTWEPAGSTKKASLMGLYGGHNDFHFKSDTIITVRWEELHRGERRFIVNKYDYSWNSYETANYDYQAIDTAHWNFTAVPYEGMMLYMPHDEVYLAADTGLKKVSQIPVANEYDRVRSLLHDGEIYTISGMDIYSIR